MLLWALPPTAERVAIPYGRIAVLTYTGAGGIVSADFLDEVGLKLADLSPHTLKVLEEVYPEWMSPQNPLDLWPAMERNGPVKALSVALEAVCADQGVDGVLLHIFIGGVMSRLDFAQVSKVARRAGKPLFCWLLGREEQIREFKAASRRQGIPVYGELHRTVECMAAWFRYGRTLQRRRNTRLFPPEQARSKRHMGSCHVRIRSDG